VAATRRLLLRCHAKLFFSRRDPGIWNDFSTKCFLLRSRAQIFPFSHGFQTKGEGRRVVRYKNIKVSFLLYPSRATFAGSRVSSACVKIRSKKCILETKLLVRKIYAACSKNGTQRNVKRGANAELCIHGYEKLNRS